jgi:hypothetical protein
MPLRASAFHAFATFVASRTVSDHPRDYLVNDPKSRNFSVACSRNEMLDLATKSFVCQQ